MCVRTTYDSMSFDLAVLKKMFMNLSILIAWLLLQLLLCEDVDCISSRPKILRLAHPNSQVLPSNRTTLQLYQTIDNAMSPVLSICDFSDRM